MNGVLVIVPCGQSKIWDRSQNAGPTLAKDAYTGPPFGLNKAFAERFGDAWMILSAKYGFIEPAFQIPAPYNITFKKPSSGPITTEKLQEQVRKKKLDRFSKIIGLGGKEYREAIEFAFAGLPVQLAFPFSGLRIGKAMQAAKNAIARNDPMSEETSHMNASAGSGTTKDVCQALHELVGGQPKFGFPFDESQLPRNGIYILFEEGELGHGIDRIVRVGTHTGNDQLRSRLKQHFMNEVKDRSIFRKNIGRCLLKRESDPFLEFWELDLTTRAARDKYRNKIDLEKQAIIEKQVSEYIQKRCRFAVFEAPDKAKRLELESKLTSTVSLCEACRPSPGWLGQHSPKEKIQSSGLWQVNELNKTPLHEHDLLELRTLLGV